MSEEEELELLRLRKAKAMAQQDPPEENRLADAVDPRKKSFLSNVVGQTVGGPIGSLLTNDDSAKTMLATGADSAALGYGPEIGAFGNPEETARLRERLQASEARNPEHALLGRIGGSTAVGMAMPATGAAASMEGRLAQSAATSGALGFASNPGPEGDRISNAEQGAFMGAGTGLMFDPKVLGKVGGYFDRASNRTAAKATLGSPQKIAELRAKGKLEDVGREVRESALQSNWDPDKGFFSNLKGAWFHDGEFSPPGLRGPERIHRMTSQKAADVADDISSDISAASFAGGRSVNMTRLGEGLEGNLSRDPFYETAKGKELLAGPLNKEVQNLRYGVGEPLSNPGQLGSDYGGVGTVPSVSHEGVDFSNYQPYTDSSSHGGLYTPGPVMAQDPMARQLGMGTPEGPGFSSKLGNHAAMKLPPPERVGDIGNPYSSPNGPESVGPSAPAPDLRERVATPSELWRLRQGIGKQINFAKTSAEMAPEEKALSEIYHGTRDPLVQSVEGQFPNPVGLSDKMSQYERLSHAKDMSFQGLSGGERHGQHPASMMSPKTAAVANFGRSTLGRGYSAVSKASETVADVMLNRPERLGKWAGPLMKAYSQDRDQYNAMVYTLLKRPEFREKVLEEPADRSVEKTVPLEEAQEQYQEEN